MTLHGAHTTGSEVNQQHLKALFVQEVRHTCLRESLQPPVLYNSPGSSIKTLQACSLLGCRPKSNKMYRPRARRYNQLPEIANYCLAFVCQRKRSTSNVLKKALSRWRGKSGIDGRSRVLGISAKGRLRTNVD